MASSILKGLVTNDGIDRLQNGNQLRRRVKLKRETFEGFRNC